MENEFYKDYQERVIPALQKQHGYKNVHQVPKVEKVVINTSVGSQSDVKQALEDAKTELALITGQRAAETRAKVYTKSAMKARSRRPTTVSVLMESRRRRASSPSPNSDWLPADCSGPATTRRPRHRQWSSSIRRL